MVGKKNKQRRNRRRQKKRQRETPNSDLREGDICTVGVLADARDAGHPLHTWADSLIVLLLEWKKEMEWFETRMNYVLKEIHDVYYAELSIGCWLNFEKQKLQATLSESPFLHPLSESLLTETEVLFDTYYYFVETGVLRKEDYEGSMKIVELAKKHVGEVMDQCPNMVGKFTRDCEYNKMKFQSYDVTPLVKYTMVFDVPKRLEPEVYHYIKFRATKEGQEFTLTGEFFQAALIEGCRNFFGAVVDSSGVVLEDAKNPQWLVEFKLQ